MKKAVAKFVSSLLVFAMFLGMMLNFFSSFDGLTIVKAATKEFIYPTEQKYWVIFREGFRDNRVEMSTFDTELSEESFYLVWNKSLKLNNTSGSTRITQFCVQDNQWCKIGTYGIPTDYAYHIIASNVDIYDKNGSLILEKTTYENGVKLALKELGLFTGYNIAGRTFSKNIDYYVKDTSSSNYNPELSNMLAALSVDVYSETDIKSSYRSLGFSNPEVYDYNGSFDPLSCGYALDFKKSDYNNDSICLVAVRGSNNTSDWIGNITLATFDNEKHIGFSTPANRIYEHIQYLIQCKNITGNIKFVIAGHSRGAAVANLLAVKLMEKGISSSNVYNYNYACPDVACKRSFPSYDNIFNLCNREDIVPFVPGTIASQLTPAGTSWGKFGKTYWFTKDAPNTYSPFADHNKWLYLEFFDQQTNPSSWSSSFEDKVDDITYMITGFITKIFCPVDVSITDEHCNEIASVVNGDVNYYNNSCGDIIIFTSGDKKVIYVDSDKKFNVNLVGTDSGKMTYAVEELNLLTNEVVESKTFTDVKLEEGKTMYSPVSEAETTENVELLLVNKDNNKNTVTHIIESDGSEYRLFLSVVTPSTRTVNYRESIIINTNSNLPNNYKIKWKVEGSGVSIKPSTLGSYCKVTSTATGNVVIRAYVVDANGNIITDENGKPISDSEYLYSEANFWLRLVYFFKKLFGISMATSQTLDII